MPADAGNGPTAAPPAAAPALADFGDWLSPMIVKELRQGLRTWVFVVAFIVLQTILVMTLLISFSAGNEESSSYLFWMLIAGILVFIVPLRGFNALAGEMKTDTLDLLMLTRLDAFRIAVGKWIALVAQSTLISVSVLPYVVLRYFGGGVNVGRELVALLLLWMLSAFVAAVAVAFSALPSIIIRTFFLLAAWFCSAMACSAVTSLAVDAGGGSPFGIFGSGSPTLGMILAVLAPLWAYACYFVLDVGASTIAPLAANHATRKRLISLAFLLATTGFVFGWPTAAGREIALGCLLVIGALAAFDCLTETPTASPSVYAPFVRRGVIGRLAAFLLAPGWATGLLFYGLIATLIATLVVTHADPPADTRSKLILITTFLSPLTPLALAQMFFRRPQRLLGPYIVCSLILLIATMLFLLMGVLSQEDSVGYVGVLTPSSALILHDIVDNDENSVLMGGIIAGVVYLVFLLVKAATPITAMCRAMKEAARTTAADQPSAS